jgi:hypothetical protein
VRDSTHQDTRDKRDADTMEDVVLRRTAIYEAGYVVAHVRLGLEHRRVIMTLRDNTFLGTTAREGTQQISDPARAKSLVLTHCAGYAALIAAGYCEAEALRDTSDDFRHAKALGTRWALSGDIAAWKMEAIELMGRPENKAAVALVAPQLLARGNVDSDWVGCLFALLAGEMTEKEFADYVRFREALS